MIGHQRSILATMGVDLWIPRTTLRHEKQAVSLFRDQVIDLQPENKIQQTGNKKRAVVEQLAASCQPTDTVQLNERAKTPLTQVKNALEVIVTPQQHLQDFAVNQTQPTFILEAYCLDHMVLLLESSDISKEQRQLWLNIQAALAGVYSELKWPLAVQSFSDARGIKAYIQGFLDVLAMDKRILILGQFELVSPTQAMQLASLQDMIDQPLLKRRLWQLMLSD